MSSSLYGGFTGVAWSVEHTSPADADAPPDEDASAEIDEALLQTLAETTNSAQTVRAVVEAARAGTGADAAFWYSRSSGKVSGPASGRSARTRGAGCAG